MNEIVKIWDFVELKYTGYTNGNIFDSNIEEDLKKIDDKAKVKKTIICVGKGFLVKGLDKELEGKEIGKEYKCKFGCKEGYGERKKELVRTLKLNQFTEQKINPQPGMVLALDNNLVKIIAVSGARVIVDFNNPLAGKELEYKFIIVRKVSDVREKATAVFEAVFKFVPEFEIKDKVILKGPKELEQIAKIYSDKFKEFLGLELAFEEKVVNSKEDSKVVGEQESDDGKKE